MEANADKDLLNEVCNCNSYKLLKMFLNVAIN